MPVNALTESKCKQWQRCALHSALLPFLFLPLSPLSWQPQCKLGPFDGVLSAAVCDAQSVCVGGAADKVAAAACKQYSKLRANETLIKLPVLHPLLLQ